MHRATRSVLLVIGATVLAAAGTTTRDATSAPAAAAPQAQLPVPHHDSIADAQRWAQIPQAAPILAVNPGAWCGAYRASDDVANEVASSGPKYHVVIAVPHDVAAEPAYQAYGWQQLADDAFRTVKRLEAFSLTRTGIARPGDAPYGWNIRFDYGTSCGAQFPDISFYEMPRTQAGYGTVSPGTFFEVTGDLAASGYYGAGNKRYLVHYAGKNSTACGESYVPDPTDSNGAKYVMIYNFLTLGITQAGGVLPVPDCGWTTDLHEMAHSMGGAVGGPQNNDGAHTWDCRNDALSYADMTKVCGDGDMYFDFGHDNYLAHGGGWYDTRYSAYWCKALLC